MEPKTGTIKKVLDKVTSANKPFKSVLIGEDWFNSFDSNINEQLKEGTNITFWFDQKGEFKNITKLVATVVDIKDLKKSRVADSVVEEVVIQPNKPDKDTKISRLAVLNTSVELHKQCDVTGLTNPQFLESVKKIAAELEAWVNR